MVTGQITVKGEIVMKRRDVIKGMLFGFALLQTGKAYADDYKKVISGDVNRLSNRENPSLGEQKHVPAIDAPEKVNPGEWFDVTVKVGFMKEHPSLPEHWITMIKLLVDGNDVAKTEFPAGGQSAPVATFRIKLEKSSVLEAVEHCNLHGTWLSDQINVKV